MTTRKPFLCVWCKHLHRNYEQVDNPDDLHCDAFPDGIPGYVLTNAEDHRFPLPDDNGIRFEDIDPADPAPIAELFGRQSAS